MEEVMDEKRWGLGLPSLPKMPSLGVSGATKTILMLVVGFVLLIMLLAALGYSGMGEVVKSEHKRKR